MSIAARVISVGALTLVSASFVSWFGRDLGDPPLLALGLLVAGPIAVVYVIVAGIVVGRSEARHKSEGRMSSYSLRVKAHLVSWAGSTGLALLILLVFLSMVASELGVGSAGNLMFALALVGPTVIMGALSSLIVEHIHGRLRNRRISRAS